MDRKWYELHALCFPPDQLVSSTLRCQESSYLTRTVLALLYQTTSHHIPGDSNLNLRHPKHMPLTYNVSETHYVPKLQCTEHSAYFDTESYAGEAKSSTDYGSQGRHDKNGDTLHATHGWDVAYKQPGVCILRKQHTAN
jgi:hypothetical protein